MGGGGERTHTHHEKLRGIISKMRWISLGYRDGMLLDTVNSEVILMTAT
jgi:hypothetical protein